MKRYLRFVILLISLSTVIAGGVQLIFPAFVLEKIGVQRAPVPLQLFATIGLFMIIFGAMALHALYEAPTSRVVILWAAIQKAGASIAVGIGIFHAVFNPMASCVALFDLFSGCLFLYYFTCLTEDESY